ncbi:transcriptional regulator, IclR family [Novosphingobium aromaticivorans DSM 12444]|uniref:Transcriptional regulator, IclR family n=1 Tax=Novosphingobium aromaticivorans (strain ATCC 700278 / DSM 12444 / CCUG 56034 / CIP 105152 / NBRC 16084 / F199) TaxID=279238 RepID=Q2G5N0_NOVAD|nr:IclR family transcriptional regulator [Novosphingobium aromaticivorans]ABD26843.1 transcriptional regulator, IclR family [Novosphingobium aromaticivorans DSM 12444]SCY43584.1 transcriptional regulator, IclR family [Novosphingobium aromaticivorans]
MNASAASNPVKSAMRTLDVIEYVVANRQGAVAQEIAGALAIPVSSLSYLLATLTERGYLTREGRRYLPGPGLQRLRAPEAALTLEDRVAPLVRALRSELNETSSFMVRRGWEVEALVTEASDHALRYAVDPGTRRPLHALAAGKLMLAWMPPQELARYFAETDRAVLTPNTRTSERDLRADFARIMARGISIAREEATVGICGMAAPVWLDGQLAGALSVAVPAVRFGPDIEARILVLLQRTAAAIQGGQP